MDSLHSKVAPLYSSCGSSLIIRARVDIDPFASIFHFSPLLTSRDSSSEYVVELGAGTRSMTAVLQIELRESL